MARRQAGLFLLVIIILYMILRYGCNLAQSHISLLSALCEGTYRK